MKKSNNTYGSIALCESWAEHIGRTFTDKTYGLNNTIGIAGISSYEEWLEKQRNESDNHHIPIGYYHDLIDGVDLTEVANDFSDLSDSDEIIVDGISGITNQQMFSLLNPNITSIIDFNNALISSY